MGFRGTFMSESGEELAILMPRRPAGETDQAFFFSGVGVSLEHLPYLPEMGDHSDFKRNGYWHHYRIIWGVFLMFILPRKGEGFPYEWILQAVLFEGEDKPRIMSDNRQRLLSEGVIPLDVFEKVERILAENNIQL
jgi:hypothetical protein